MVYRQLSIKSRQKGLTRARETRKVRAEIKKSLKQGRVNLKDVLLNKKIFDKIASMRLVELVSSLPGIGRVRAERILAQELNISLSKRVGGMGSKQKLKFYNYFNID